MGQRPTFLFWGFEVGMDLVNKIVALLGPVLESMGYELVRVQIMGDRRVVLQIMADRADGKGMTVEDCARISRRVSAVMDVEDPITDAYTLEVSSPGIDRPLTRRKDFAQWVGFDAKIELREMLEGRKRFSGVLRAFDEATGDVTIEVEGESYVLPFTLIAKAKLTLTDALIKAVTVAEDDAEHDTQDTDSEDTDLNEEQD